MSDGAIVIDEVRDWVHACVIKPAETTVLPAALPFARRRGSDAPPPPLLRAAAAAAAVKRGGGDHIPAQAKQATSLHTMQPPMLQECRIRILDAQTHAASCALRDGGGAFAAGLQRLQEAAGAYLSAVERQAARIEAERLRAVGLRNKVAALQEVCMHVCWGEAFVCMWRARGQTGLPAAGLNASASPQRLSPPSLGTRARANKQERQRRREELLAQLQEHQAELDRLAAEEASLRRVRAEQELAVARLADPFGDGGGGDVAAAAF